MAEEEITEETETDTEIRKLGALFGPEGTVMLSGAILLDLAGVACLLFSADALSPIVDIIGIIFIGGWLYFRKGFVPVPERTKRKIKTGFIRRLFRGKWKRYLTPFIGELAPIAGALPVWTFAVYYELTE